MPRATARNRREACRRADVAPNVTDLNGTDPVAYVLSADIYRRHMSKGAKAMARLLTTSKRRPVSRAPSSPHGPGPWQSHSTLSTLVELLIREKIVVVRSWAGRTLKTVFANVAAEQLHIDLGQPPISAISASNHVR